MEEIRQKKDYCLADFEKISAFESKLFFLELFLNYLIIIKHFFN